MTEPRMMLSSLPSLC